MSNVCGEDFNLIFLDTNALSNLISNYKNFLNNLLKKFPSENIYYIFSIYNVLEISNGDISRFESLKKIFSNNKCLMFLTYQDILQEEKRFYDDNKFEYENISFSFVPNYKKEYSFEWFIEEIFPKIKQKIDIQSEAEESLLEFYNNIKNSGKSYKNLNEEYEIEVIKEFLNVFGITITDENRILSTFKSCRMVNKSIYNRITQGNKILKKNDLYDAMISATFPYVDSIITESYQAEMINQIKRKIPEMKNTTIYKISEFYDK